ncbi:MAG: beta-ketoacyl-[acyl-carrier-protein] synthase family protein, partial [bacterium]
MRERQRVVVTGMGVISPVGLDEKTLWQNIIAGRHGIRTISRLKSEEFKSRNCAEVDQTLLMAQLEASKLRPGARAVDMTALATTQALGAAGLLNGPEPVPRNIATILGTGGGVVESLEEGYRRYAEGDLRSIRPTTVVRGMSNLIASSISIMFRLTGPNYIIASACASSTCAIGVGMRMVRDGYAERVLCGGAEALFVRSIYGAWDKIGAMSINPDSCRASRPFDVNRDGFIMGEGAAMLVIESRDAAIARGARIRGEICGFGEASDAEHLTRPSPHGQVAAMRAALADADVRPDEIGFINAHGTSTEANDECECQSIREVFGDSVNGLLVASNKSLFGHLMGASGAMETIVT